MRTNLDKVAALFNCPPPPAEMGIDRRDLVKKSDNFGALYLPGLFGAGTRQQLSSYRVTAIEGYQSNPYAYQCAQRISWAVAGLPIVLEQPSGKQHAKVEDHPVIDLLNNPSPGHSRDDYFTELVLSMALDGNGFTFLGRPITNPTAGRPYELHVLQPDAVNPIPDPNDISTPLRYDYTNASGRTEHYQPTQVSHIKLFNPLNRLRGMSPMQASRFAIDHNNSAMVWNMSLLRNGARFSQIFSTDATLGENQREQATNSLMSMYAGADRAGSIGIFGDGLKPVPDSYAPKDMDWNSGEQLSATQICIAMGVPPEIIGMNTKNKTYNNLAEAHKAFYQNTVLIYAQLILNKLNVDLLPLYGGNKNLRLVINLQEVPALRESQDSLHTRVINDVMQGILTRNEAREAQGYDPLPIPEMDVPLIPMTYVPVGMAGDTAPVTGSPVQTDNSNDSGAKNLPFAKVRGARFP